MANWAYQCQACGASEETWFVSQLDVAGLPENVRIVRIKVGAEWRCARLLRDQPHEVDGSLLRQFVASSEQDCPECTGWAETRSDIQTTDAHPRSTESAPQASVSPAGSNPLSTNVQAAAVSLQERRFVIVVVSMELVRSAGEADMAIETLQPHFGGAPLVLMAQKEDGSPVYYGESDLVNLLGEVPLDKMPWKEYRLG